MSNDGNFLKCTEGVIVGFVKTTTLAVLKHTVKMHRQARLHPISGLLPLSHHCQAVSIVPNTVDQKQALVCVVVVSHWNWWVQRASVSL